MRFRLENIVDQATEYKNRLGISYDDCRKVDTFNYKARIRSNREVCSRYFIIHGLVCDQQLFDMPADHEGMPYAKGGDYLAIDFLESDWTREKVENGLEGLAKLRSTEAALILTSYQVIHIADSVMIFYSRSDQPV